ncbi:MAG: hypothetical protein ACRED3_18090, partial [Bradyrhizobium sp.]
MSVRTPIRTSLSLMGAVCANALIVVAAISPPMIFLQCIVVSFVVPPGSRGEIESQARLVPWKSDQLAA